MGEKVEKIDVNIYPAKGGDAFLIKFPNKKNIVIDMGYKDTYYDYIKNDFESIQNDTQCINLLIITHIDEDHIEGAIQFIKENCYSDKPKIVGVSEVWHNSYRHLQISKEGNLTSEDQETAILEEVKKSNSVSRIKEINESKEVSTFQGSTLASYLYVYNYSWNESFYGLAVSVDNKYDNNIDGISIKILSPNTSKLKSLSRKWLSFLKGKKYNFKITDDKIFDDAYEFYVKNIEDFEINEEKLVSSKNIEDSIELLKDIKASKTDASASNGSSIAFELIYENTKMLFLGDCHEDVLIDYFNKDINSKVHYDLIKLPHHGSLRNNSNWINFVKAKYYIFSTDGINHDEHPSIELISKIICNNKESQKKIFLVFNYNITIVEKFEDKSLKDLYNYDIIYPGSGKKVNIQLGEDSINGI